MISFDVYPQYKEFKGDYECWMKVYINIRTVLDFYGNLNLSLREVLYNFVSNQMAAEISRVWDVKAIESCLKNIPKGTQAERVLMSKNFFIETIHDDVNRSDRYFINKF